MSDVMVVELRISASLLDDLDDDSLIRLLGTDALASLRDLARDE